MHKNEKARKHDCAQLLERHIPSPTEILCHSILNVLVNLGIGVLQKPVNQVIRLIKLELTLLTESKRPEPTSYDTNDNPDKTENLL